MRKISIFAFTLLMFSFSANAQTNEQRNEIRLSVSDGLPLDIGMALGSAFGSVFTNRTVLHNSSTGSWSLGYRNHISNRIAFGGDFSFQAVKSEFEHKKNGSESTEEITYLTVMPALDVTYYRSNVVRLYGTVMAGVGLLSTKVTRSDEELNDGGDDMAAFAFQLNPIGVRVGKQIAGFAELGVGTKGFVTLGLSAAF